jgi:hypothetical protein
MLIRIFFPGQLHAEQDIDKVVIARLNKWSYGRRDQRDYDQKSDWAVGVHLSLAVGNHK